MVFGLGSIPYSLSRFASSWSTGLPANSAAVNTATSCSFPASKTDAMRVRHLDRLRIRLELADERTRPFPLAPIDVELAVLEEREPAAENGWRRGIVMVEMVMAHGEDVRFLRGVPNDLPQFLLPRALGRMRRQVVAVRAEPDARVQEDGDVRRLDQRRHGSRAEAVRREGRNLHRITAWPHIYRETTDRISVAMAVAAAAGLAAS